MAKIGKRSQKAQEVVTTALGDQETLPLNEAIKVLKSVEGAKFDESVDISIRLGVDPRHADQMVRASVVLPNGTGKTVRVIAFAQGEQAKVAEEAGADVVGADDLIEKIQGGWLEFDKAVATPDMMRSVSKVARVLGPRGLMPNPKTGTVSPDLDQAIKLIKAGKVDYRVDKGSNVHASIGKKSFSEEQLQQNIASFVDSVMRAKPASAKGQYLRSAAVSTTMSPSLSLNTTNLPTEIREHLSA